MESSFASGAARDRKQDNSTALMGYACRVMESSLLTHTIIVCKCLTCVASSFAHGEHLAQEMDNSILLMLWLMAISMCSCQTPRIAFRCSVWMAHTSAAGDHMDQLT